MSDLEQTYSEVLEQLAKAVEANRMLTERLEAYEVREATVRRYLVNCYDDPKGRIKDAILSMLDQPIGSVHTEQQEKP